MIIFHSSLSHTLTLHPSFSSSLSLPKDELIAETHIQKYLQHTRYIDELLKFFEEEQYKLVSPTTTSSHYSIPFVSFSLFYSHSHYVRLSLKLEPDLVQLRHPPPTTTARPSSSALRTSKSHEDLLTPFSSGTRGGDSAHSSAGPSSSVLAGKVWTPQPQHRTLTLHHTLGDVSHDNIKRESLRLSAILNDDDELPGDVQITVYQNSPDIEVKGRSQTLPRGTEFSGEWPPRDSPPCSSCSSSATSSKSNVRCPGTPVKDIIYHPPPSAPPVVGRNPNDSPSQWRRHHRKSFSVGTK